MFTLAFSPCPNDTFIFDALVNKKIDTEGLEFEVYLEDVQTLNQWALEGKMDFTKMSYGVLPLILDNYKLLNSGGALGKGVGPLLISNKELGIGTEEFRMRSLRQNHNNGEHQTSNIEHPTSNISVAIPGENTTAHLLFSLAYPNATNKKFMVFSEIENYVLNNKNACGVIIHENRFTYQQKGLHKILDLGEYWEKTINLPIPLGGIVAHNSIEKSIAQKVDELIKESLEYAFEHYPMVSAYVKQHAQEMEENVMRQHIDLYVNNFSIDLGVEGKAAVVKLLEVYNNLHNKEKQNDKSVFVN